MDSLIRVGDKLELRAINSIKDTSDNVYTSKIMDIKDSEQLNIAMPIEKGQIIPLSVGDKYDMYIYTKKGLYQCQIEITERFKELNLHTLTVVILTEIQKFQRRQYYRLDCLLDITYHVMTSDNHNLSDNNNNNEYTKLDYFTDEKNKLEIFKGIVTDLSGGGARFSSDMQLNETDTILMNINLPVGSFIKELCLECCVISSEKILNANAKTTYTNRVEFVELLKEDRECIIKFIFEEERKLIRKGKSSK